MPSFTPPLGYRGVKVVRSFDALLETPLVDGINALCWPRTLSGDFDEVVRQLKEQGQTAMDSMRRNGTKQPETETVV